MRFVSLPLGGAWLIELEPHTDARGYFARSYCEREFAAQGLNTRWPQSNVSYSAAAGTLRGMHYQAAPHAQIKMVRCVRGAIHDVIADLRPSSPTYRRWFGVELTAEPLRWLYVPEGFAHGFLTLTGEVEVEYMMSDFYTPEAERGFRYNDPFFSIAWPGPVAVISPNDAAWPNFAP